ncbi:unnamed protein product, partial [Meganyctiphanes norvegica]
QFLRIREVVMASVLLVTSFLLHITLQTQAALTTLTGCLRGNQCSQCNSDHFTRDKSGEMLCCPSCASSSIYYGNSPSKWCFCSSGPGDGAGFGGGDRQGHVLNTDVNMGQAGLSRPLHEALSLMAEAIESLESRVTNLEYLLDQRGNQLPSNTVDRVGQFNTSPQHITSDCMAHNFKRIGDLCYHISVWNKSRKNWKDAQSSCEDMGGKLAEPLSTREYSDLAKYLHTRTITSGFSYWIGGVYPGVSWYWAYAGTQVSLHQAYWSMRDRNGYSVKPGDFNRGRCLHFLYLYNDDDYRFSADGCGNEKYYICQELDKSSKL